MTGFNRALQRGDDQLFDDITLENQVAKTDTNGETLLDEHGNIRWEDKTTTDVSGEVTTRGQSTFARRASGIDRDIDAIIWISDPSVTFTSAEDIRTQKATRISAIGKTFKVREVFDEQNGRLRGHVEVE